MDVSKNRGVSPKMDGFIMENPQKKLGWFGGENHLFLGNILNGAKKSTEDVTEEKESGYLSLKAGEIVRIRPASWRETSDGFQNARVFCTSGTVCGVLLKMRFPKKRWNTKMGLFEVKV